MANKDLAFWSLADQIIKLARSGRGIITMPTGTGKTTQCPQALYQEGSIYISVPKRLLAIELAIRVAEEMESRLGDLVGYIIRGESVVSAQTRIIFMTEGILRTKILADPMLRGVSLILFDEFHNRALLSDFNVALVERAQSEGSQVRFLLMSATIDATPIANHFQCGIVDGSHLSTTHPIEERYVQAPMLYQAAAEQAASLLAEKTGNGLIFMPGKGEIEQTIEELRRLKLEHVRVLPLHGDLDAEDRHAPFTEVEERTITVATDIVETGATLPNISWVIDSGLARQTVYDPIADISSLRVIPIARDRLKQRRGRCGRVRPGVYVALFDKENHLARPERTEPEIKRVPLREVVLNIKALGLSREGKPLRLLDNPDKANWKEAKSQLQQLQLVDRSPGANITERGKRAVTLGCDPREAAMLLAAEELGCLHEMAKAIAEVQGKRLLYVPRNERERDLAKIAHQKFRTSSFRCDSWAAINVVRAAEAREEGMSLAAWCRQHYVSYPALREILRLSGQLVAQFKGYQQKNDGTEDALCQAIAAGFPDRLYEYDGYSRGHWFKDSEGNYALLGRESIISPSYDNQIYVAWGVREVPLGRRGLTRILTNVVRI